MHVAQEQLNRLAESRIRAERQMGLLLLGSVARGGLGSNSTCHSSKTGGSSKPLPPGISHFQSSQWQFLGSIPDPEFEGYLAKARHEGWTPSVRALRRFLAPATPTQPPHAVASDDPSWLLDHARQVLPSQLQLTSAVGSAMPSALRAAKPDAPAAWLLDARRSSCAEAWMKALQRHLAVGDDHQAIVALHVRTLYQAAVSRAICLPKPAIAPDCAVAYYGRRVHAFALVFREVGALLAPMEIA